MAIHTHIRSGIWELSIDRSSVRNAIDATHARALYDAVKAFEDSKLHSVAVLYGVGEHFCAGADLHEIAQSRPNPLHDFGALAPMGPTRLILSKPIIAAVEGYAVAGGLELACWCDLRVASESARFGVFCRSVGVPLIDGGTHRLPRLIGQSRALDLILTGREINAQTAHDWGLVNRLVPRGQALDEARKLAQKISALPQMALRTDRLSSIEQWGLSEADALRSEFRRGKKAIREGQAGAKFFSDKSNN